MKRLKIFLVLVLTLIPTFVNASEDKFNIVVEDNANSEKVVNGSSVTAGNNVSTNNTVNGIDMLFGNSVIYESDSDYAVIAGNNVNVNGIIKNDGFIFGNLITFDLNFSSQRDLFVFGNTVTLKGTINRDITIYASNVILENVVIEGNASINTSILDIKDIDSTISSNALIGSINLLDSEEVKLSLKDQIYNFFVDYAGILVIFVSLALIVPQLFNHIENKYKDVRVFDLFSSLGFGALLLIFIPVVFILLLISTFGISLAILLLIIYVVSVWLSTIFFGYLIGLIIWKKFINKDINILLVGLIGISIVSVLKALPIIGFYITLISMMVGLGIIFKLIKRD